MSMENMGRLPCQFENNRHCESTSGRDGLFSKLFAASLTAHKDYWDGSVRQSYRREIMAGCSPHPRWSAGFAPK